MQKVKKACTGCAGSVIGVGALMHTPCILIALSMASGVSALTATGMSYYGSIAMMVASGAVLAHSLRKKGSATNLVKIGATSSLVAASLTMIWSQISSPVRSELLESQSTLMTAPNMSVWDKERLIRTSFCGEPRNTR